MTDLQKTVLYEKHLEQGAQIVEFGGWLMPIQYSQGVIHEHLACRKKAGLFDVSHMGRFVFGGTSGLDFLQKVLTNNAAALDVGESQYTIIPDENGHAIDDAYLYRFEEEGYLLVVNASNARKDWLHLQELGGSFENLKIEDRTEELAMLSLQGPASKEILEGVIESGPLPAPLRNHLSEVVIGGCPVRLARTGYTGDPLGFELFMEKEAAEMVWDRLLAQGAEAVGLGARDTLRLEASLPLYGHEFGDDPEGRPIPIFASPLAKFAVSFSDLKGDSIGRKALGEQFADLKRILAMDFSNIRSLPRLIMPLAVTGRGIAREGCPVFYGDRQVGYVTSGTMVPYWTTAGSGIAQAYSDIGQKRAIALALLDADIASGDRVEIEIRKKRTQGVVVPYHMRAEAPPRARAILWDQLGKEVPAGQTPPGGAADRYSTGEAKAHSLLQKALENSQWRQRRCINLIPSEQAPSALAKLLSVMDPCSRYAEHKKVKAFGDEEIFYYQGTAFISEVENLLIEELKAYLGCRNAEARVISGQMANTAVFSGLVDYLNRADRKSEQRRIGKIINNHILNGGHLSAQPMGALRDFVARDPQRERPAVVNFPVQPENPYKINVAACRQLLEIHEPELIIFGKSMTIYPEPVGEIKAMVDDLGLSCLLMYDMAHVLGLVGPYFQEPFAEGADVVTGSTHKTFFGTQRGIIAGNYDVDDAGYGLWEAIERRTFPGSVSNHHLGTLLGLLMSTYEMNCFKDEYQQQVIANARAFARALDDCGLEVAGIREEGFTHTHQVIVHVGYARGPAMAQLLEDNNIIVNYQATPEEEGFTASGSLRLGVAEMTRFGMQEKDFEILAQLMSDVLQNDRTVREEVEKMRSHFTDLHFCFDDAGKLDDLLQKLHGLI